MRFYLSIQGLTTCWGFVVRIVGRFRPAHNLLPQILNLLPFHSSFLVARRRAAGLAWSRLVVVGGGLRRLVALAVTGPKLQEILLSPWFGRHHWNQRVNISPKTHFLDVHGCAHLDFPK